VPVAGDAANALRAYVDAQEQGIASAAPGAALRGIDAAMAASLGQAGFGDVFLRPVFHGVASNMKKRRFPAGMP
jgi:Xaa-Pro aminopeptidase